MHKIEKRAVVVDNQIVIRPMMYLALSYDHRIVDGKGAVTERKLADQSGGRLLAPSLTLHSSHVADGTRTLVLTPMARTSPRSYSASSARHESRQVPLGAPPGGHRLPKHRG